MSNNDTQFMMALVLQEAKGGHLQYLLMAWSLLNFQRYDMVV